MRHLLLAIDVLHIPPFIATAVLEPEDCRRDIGSNLGAERRVDRLISAAWHEYLHFVLLVANGALIQAALDTAISNVLAAL